MNSRSILQRTRPMLLAVTFPAAMMLLNNSCRSVAHNSTTPPSSESPTASATPAKSTEPAAENPVESAPVAAAEAAEKPISEEPTVPKPKEKAAASSGKSLATFGNGCFWCTEAVMERLEGVSDAKSGYMGGHVENPTYEQVCGKNTGHAEVVQVTYDPSKISYEELLDIFWYSHDPTTKDRQGNDIGPQYRSVVFYHTSAQKYAAQNSMAKENASGKFGAPIVTEITEATKFWEAEADHQDFFTRNPGNPYCRMMIPPKLKKLGLD